MADLDQPYSPGMSHVQSSDSRKHADLSSGQTGKTAPRLLQDILDYDPGRPRKDGRNIKNLIAEPAPRFTEPKLYPLRTLPQDCHHILMLKTAQSQYPVPNEQPTENTIYVVASYCSLCMWHIEITVDFTRQSNKRRPCELGTEYTLHHLQYIQNNSRIRSKSELGGCSKYDNWKELHYFQCSSATCPAIVEVRLTPPRLSIERLNSVIEPAKLFARGQTVIAADPERYAGQGKH